jgi:hypothetical protein
LFQVYGYSYIVVVQTQYLDLQHLKKNGLLDTLTILRNNEPYSSYHANQSMNGVQRIRQAMIYLFNIAHGISEDLSVDNPMDIFSFITMIHDATHELRQLISMYITPNI